MMSRYSAVQSALFGASLLTLMAGGALPAQAANTELKIGFVGVTSGPAAAWGTSNVRSMQTLAAQWNEAGGVKIGDRTYNIKIVTFDDQKDPKRAIAGMEKMAQEGIHYVVGPNVDDGAAAVRPVAEAKGIIYFPYAFPKALYTKPASNAVLGMVANYQSGPAIYKYLHDNKGVKTIAFVAANESDPLSQRDGGVAAARELGLNVLADKDTYQNDTRDFTPVLTPIVKLKPDLLVLSDVSPSTRRPSTAPRPRTPTSKATRRFITPALRRSARSASSRCRSSSPNTRTASSKRCSLPMSIEISI